MNQIGFPLLSLVTWLPALGALLLLVLPRDNSALIRQVALGVSGITLIAAIAVYGLFDPRASGFQLADSFSWVPSWGLGYSLAVDGLNLWLVLLTAFMMPFAFLASGRGALGNARASQVLLLVLETGILGTFLAQDLLLFYVFFEFTLIPTSLLLGIWGGAERTRAAAKFFLYTFAGSLFMLLAIIALYLLNGQATGLYSFGYTDLLNGLQSEAGPTMTLSDTTERLLFFGFFIAFAIKIALWPFHTWMPLLHAQTPADGSVDVGAVLLKLIGGYGMVRFTIGLFPEAALWAAPAIGVLAVIGIIYGAWVAYNESDMKQLLAYSSVSHLSFVVLGIYALNAIGVSGALLQMVNYGLTTGALFLAIGMLETRFQRRGMRDFGGLWKVMPAFGGLLLAFVLASIGLPGLNGFIGEFTIMQGAWLSAGLGWRFVAVAVLGVILAAAYLLHMFRLTFMGPLANEAHAGEMTRNQLLQLGVLLIPMIVIGLYPNIVFAPMQPAVDLFAQSLNTVLASR